MPILAWTPYIVTVSFAFHLTSNPHLPCSVFPWCARWSSGIQRLPISDVPGISAEERRLSQRPCRQVHDSVWPQTRTLTPRFCICMGHIVLFIWRRHLFLLCAVWEAAPLVFHQSSFLRQRTFRAVLYIYHEGGIPVLIYVARQWCYLVEEKAFRHVLMALYMP